MTVSLVTHNGLRWLPGCVESVRRQELTDFELLVLDNASTDTSQRWLRAVSAQEPRITLTESPVNLGFAAAHNRHIERSQGEFVLLLNQDVELHPAFLREAVDALARRPTVAALQARLRRLGPDDQRTRTLDSTGLVMQRDRRVVSRRQGMQEGQRDLVPGPVWGADGPAPVYRRSALGEAREPRTAGGWEVLDEEFFMYKEDVDLAWRLRMLGWQAWYQPTAVAWHARTARGSSSPSAWQIAKASLAAPPWVRALSWRNQRLMQIKNDRFEDVARDLPALASREVLSLAFMLAGDRSRLASLVELRALLPTAIRKRRFLQAQLSRKRGPSRGHWVAGSG